jgi:hypothetical protein
MSRIKIFFKDTARVIKTVPGKTFYYMATEYQENVPCVAKCLKGAFCLVPVRPLYPATTYCAHITNLGRGDTLLQGTIILTFRTRR